jgi:homoserine O-acetyltransferase
MSDKEYDIFELGNWKLQNGMTIPNAKIAYKTFGDQNNLSKVIIFPTWYSGTHKDNEWLIGVNKTLSPKNYFIIIPNMFGNGLSSSPSNQLPPYDGPRFPNVTLYDNVKAQHKLITEVFNVKKIFAVIGWSMGAQQSYQWASLYPDMVERCIPFCGSAKTSIHNKVFLEGPKSALMADNGFKNGWYKPDEPPRFGLRAFGRVYAGWGMSQAFYREELYKSKLKYESLEDFLVGFWEGYFQTKDANNLLCMLWTWQNGNISDNEIYNKNFELALKSIKAKCLIMPCSHDLYFTPEDNEYECLHIKNSEYCLIKSVWGHWAGGPGTNPIDSEFIDLQLAKFFKS